MSEKSIILFSLCICAKDGIISEVEEIELFNLFNEYAKDKKIPYKKISKSKFEEIVVEFFNSKEQLEDYIHGIQDSESLTEILEIASLAASSDGLDIQENIAFKKTLIILNIDEWVNL